MDLFTSGFVWKIGSTCGLLSLLLHECKQFVQTKLFPTLDHN